MGGDDLAPFHKNQELDMIKSFATFVTACALLAAYPAHAQIGKAASEASDAAKHKIDEKRADSEAKKSGPVGKAVNTVKSKYHKNRAKNSANKAKQAVKDAV